LAVSRSAPNYVYPLPVLSRPASRSPWLGAADARKRDQRHDMASSRLADTWAALRWYWVPPG